jgi:hypothetical protein
LSKTNWGREGYIIVFTNRILFSFSLLGQVKKKKKKKKKTRGFKTNGAENF